MPRSNPEQRRIWMRDYYRAHRAEIAEQKQGYYQAHAEARRAYQREYRRRKRAVNKQQALEQAMPGDWRLIDQHLEQANEAIFDMLRDRSSMDAQIVSAKQQVEEARAFLVVNGGIDGKNEEQRRAQLTLLLKDDEDYQALCCQLADLTASYEARGAELEFQRNKLTALKIKARIAAAMLEYLAAE